MINSYNILRKDRKNGTTPWGGVAIYYKEIIPAFEFQSENDNDIEAVWLDATIKGQKLLTASVYRPPQDNTFLPKFNQAHNEILHRTNIIIFGDFNIDMSKSAESLEPAILQNYKSILYMNKLTNIISQYTRVTDSSKTVIDHALVSNLSKSVRYDPCLSDQKLIFTVMKLKRLRKPPIFKTVNYHKDVNWKVIQEENTQTPWWITTMFDDINDTYWAWQ